MFVHWRRLIYGPARGLVGSRGASSDWPATISRVRRVARAIAPPIEQPPPLPSTDHRQSVATRRRVRVLCVCVCLSLSLSPIVVKPPPLVPFNRALAVPTVTSFASLTSLFNPFIGNLGCPLFLSKAFVRSFLLIEST